MKLTYDPIKNRFSRAKLPFVTDPYFANIFVIYHKGQAVVGIAYTDEEGKKHLELAIQMEYKPGHRVAKGQYKNILGLASYINGGENFLMLRQEGVITIDFGTMRANRGVTSLDKLLYLKCQNREAGSRLLKHIDAGFGVKFNLSILN